MGSECIDTCLWCGKTEAEHGGPGPMVGRFGITEDMKLCPVEDVTSQFWSSRAAARKLAELSTEQKVRLVVACGVVFHPPDETGEPSFSLRGTRYYP